MAEPKRHKDVPKERVLKGGTRPSQTPELTGQALEFESS
jgi:hypothetical protein